MVTSDTKSMSSLAPDSPPSYDSILPEPSTPSGSSNAAAAADHPTPKHIQHLFSSPPNAEPLLGKGSAPYTQVSGITTHVKWGRQVTFDPRLQNPAVLYDWIRAQALIPPKLKLRCVGAHFEIPHRDEVVQDNGVTRHRRKGQTERVVDFDFFVDVSSVLDHPETLANIQLRAVPPDRPTYRGTLRPTFAASFAPAPLHRAGYQPLETDVGVTDVGRTETSEERTPGAEEVNKWRIGKGYPLWVDVRSMPEFWEDRAAKTKGKTRRHTGAISLRDVEEGDTTQVSPRPVRFGDTPTLKAWCEAYCRDQGSLKSFMMRKWIWGWEMAALESAVKSAIISTGYQSNELKVEWEFDDYVVEVRPPNLLSRLVWDTPVWLMLFVVLLYPLIWAWQRLHPNGGAPYDMASASYALKYYPPLPSTFPGESVDRAQDRLPALYKLHPEIPPNPHLQPGPRGVHYLLGRKEGGWFREWEERIRMAVRMRYKGELVGTTVGDVIPPSLDGY